MGIRNNIYHFWEQTAMLQPGFQLGDCTAVSSTTSLENDRWLPAISTLPVYRLNMVITVTSGTGSSAATMNTTKSSILSSNCIRLYSADQTPFIPRTDAPSPYIVAAHLNRLSNGWHQQASQDKDMLIATTKYETIQSSLSPWIKKSHINNGE